MTVVPRPEYYRMKALQPLLDDVTYEIIFHSSLMLMSKFTRSNDETSINGDPYIYAYYSLALSLFKFALLRGNPLGLKHHPDV